MKYVLRWTPIAREDYALILGFIETDFGSDKALVFLEKTEKILDRILDFPSIYPISSKRKNVRKAVITKQTSLFYTINKQEIWILEFIDNRKS
jgi:plasmid stabilization system protein ParE